MNNHANQKKKTTATIQKLYIVLVAWDINTHLDEEISSECQGSYLVVSFYDLKSV